MRCTCTHAQQLTRRVLISNRRKVDKASQLCAFPCMEHSWRRSSCRKQEGEKREKVSGSSSSTVVVVMYWLLWVAVIHHGCKSINPFPHNVNSDGPVLLSLACAQRNTLDMGIGRKGERRKRRRTNGFLHKAMTIKISVEVVTPPVLAPDIDS